MLNKLKIKNLKLKINPGGYAAMFSFLVILAVFAIVIGVFSSLAIKSVARTRINLNDLKNMYAAEAFAEDVLRRIYDAGVADASDEEVLEVGDGTITLTLTLEGLEKRHDFNSQIQDKYSHNQTLLMDDTDPLDIKIKEWKDSL